MILKETIFSIIPLFNLTTAPLPPQAAEEKSLISVGLQKEEEEDQIAGGDRDRDRNIPMLYDKNRMRLERQRDRAMLNRGGCCPPGGPYENCVPCPQVNPDYDMENHRYKKKR